MGYVIIFAVVLVFLILTRNVEWNNWIFVGLISLTAILFGIAIANGFGSSLAIDHKVKVDKLVESYSISDIDPLSVSEKQQPEEKSWIWWKLSIEFFFLTLLSIPFAFHDEWIAAWDHVREQWQLRSARIRRRREQIRQREATEATTGTPKHTGSFWRLMEKFLPVEIAGEIIGEGAIHLLTGIFRTFGFGRI